MSAGTIFWPVREHLKNYIDKSLHCFWVPIDVILHRHEDEAIPEIFRQSNEFFLHHVSDFTFFMRANFVWPNDQTVLLSVESSGEWSL